MFDATGGEGILRADRVDLAISRYEEIGYARNPLARIIQMHNGFTELPTGITYQSPWQREDARFR
jgi:hypothetical protein